MQKTVETIVEHPIASVIVIGCIMRGIATIITAARGNSVQPIVTFTKNMAKDVCEGVKTDG